ncbi:glucosyl-3-phosphoglycerate synthase [Jatrophihabitans endophyticus]|uniref:Glucosyl-3-phosphoglycerate synthase n=1 Tax=Jatrophihabitans endophyticus TaxID=1206085 RepID=A0A1M5UPB1_9ACTN|nr:glucosyl-3-phosphoglycerate synthase [Jatrophihabitans endophyticus]SHH64503.1 glucosyl-3-phosphoglycerate synthase [Jatrophihabitans endophyticus]
MHPAAAAWFGRRTSAAADWPVERVARLRAEAGTRVSVVIPARDEAASVGAVVERIRRDLALDHDVVAEVVVMDSLSTDDTAAVARAAGAGVHSVADVRPDLGVHGGKGEALWKSQFVTRGDVCVFVDADLTEWGTHFVTGLLGPLLADPDVRLVKGFYDRVLDDGGRSSTQGGRVTELVARPLLASRWPQLGAVVQPLAGEWAIRRAHFERLPVPTGYGVEFATLVDTVAAAGLDAVAQVDLGSRAHRHQNVHDLGAMALEILTVADRRSFGEREVVPGTIAQFDRAAPGRWRERVVPVDERPPAVSVAGYAPC